MTPRSVAGKDLRIEMRSRVLVNQVAPFGAIVLVLFAFALGPDAEDLLRAAPGVFWVAVLFAGLLAIQRAFAIESRTAPATACGLRASIRRACSSARRRRSPPSWSSSSCCSEPERSCCSVRMSTMLWALVAACVAGTAGLAGSGVLYGALAAGLRVRETLLPLLVLPVVAPVLVAGTKVWQSALQTQAAGRPPRRGAVDGCRFSSCSQSSTWSSEYFSYGVLQEEAE